MSEEYAKRAELRIASCACKYPCDCGSPADDLRAEVDRLTADNLKLRAAIDDLSFNPTADDWIADGVAAALNVDASGINALARARTLPEPIHGFVTRDFITDANEELADARNYVCWAIRQTNPVLSVDLERALGAIIQAFVALGAARTVLQREAQA